MIRLRAGSVWLDEIGVVFDVEITTTYRNGGPFGLSQVSWSLDVPPLSSPRALEGRPLVEVWEGPIRLGLAQLSEPERGTPWRLHARGIGSVLAGALAQTSDGTAPSTRPDVAIDAAITRLGLPLTRPASISSSDFVAADSRLTTVGDLLDAWASENGRAWGVTARGEVVAVTDPTTPSLLLMPSTPLMGTADDEYVTHLTGRYVTAVTGTPPQPSAWAQVTVGDDAAAARWGRVEKPVDLTALGLIDSGRAASILQGRLNDGRARMAFTGAVTGDSTNLFRIGGTPPHLSLLRAGSMLRIAGVLDSLGRLVVGGTQDVVLGETRYRDGESEIYLAPVGMVARDFASVLADAVAPEEPGLFGVGA